MRARHRVAPLWRVCAWRRRLGDAIGSAKGRVKVLIYHAVADAKLEQFRRHIDALGRAYAFLTPEGFADFLRGKRVLEGMHVLVTFDDGFGSSRRAAEAVLAPFGIKALFFVAVNFVGQTAPRWRDFVRDRLFAGSPSAGSFGDEYAPMTWRDVEWLVAQGHTVGSHTFNHRALRSLTPERLAHEVIESAEALERRLGVTVKDFAAPFGTLASVSEEAFATIRRRYEFCYSGIRGYNLETTAPMAIRRDAIGLDDPVGYVRLQVEDGLGDFYRARRRRLDAMATVSRT